MSTAPLTVTLDAAKKVHELIQEDDNSKLYFRLGVTGGGCSGMQYDIRFDGDIDPEFDFLYQKSLKDDNEIVPYDFDQLIANDGYKENDAIIFIVDSVSLGYLRGATIDYRTNDLGEGEFVIVNPNAKTSCGCGSSFTVEE